MLPTIESISKHSRSTVIRNVACWACDSSACADTELCRCNRINWETDTTDAQCTPQTPCRHKATRQFSSRCELSMTLTIRLDTIRDAILTCDRKPTWVSLIYRTETTTKSGKQKKLKSTKKRIRSEVSVNSPGNPCSQSWRRKGRLRL